MSVYRLPKILIFSPDFKSKLKKDFENFATKDMPKDWEAYVQAEYGVDVSSTYAGIPIKNPFGKASGQLSLNAAQVRTDGEAGLGFVILKTVIAQDEAGSKVMQEWAINETKMLVQEITGAGETGFTITWKGRGWYDTFEAYLKLLHDALDLGENFKMLVVPSVKYHLPTSEEFKASEFPYTTQSLQKIWTAKHPQIPMPLEKDFSPTLANPDRSHQKEFLLHNLTHITQLIKKSASKPEDIRVGIKIMNAMLENTFQVEMLRTILSAEVKPDFLILFNRLFDSKKEFEGKIGIDYGGPALSHRNLKVLDAWLEENSGKAPIEFSATGNICSGRMMVEYALRGATSGQLHTYFQLPNPQYPKKEGSKTARALHQLIFQPEDGLIASLLHLRETQGITQFKDLAGFKRPEIPTTIPAAL